MLSEKEDCLMFPLFPSQAVDRTSNEWKDTVADWVEVLGGYEKALEWCASQGAKHYEERHKDRGLLLGISSLDPSGLMIARDRVNLLLDPDTPFLELGSFAGYKLDTSSPSASLITGIGVIWYYPQI